MAARIRWVPLSAAVCHGLTPALLYENVSAVRGSLGLPLSREGLAIVGVRLQSAPRQLGLATSGRPDRRWLELWKLKGDRSCGPWDGHTLMGKPVVVVVQVTGVSGLTRTLLC